MITRESLEKRLELLRGELAELQANQFAHEGAIQDCEFWIKQLDQPESKDEIIQDKQQAPRKE